MTSRLLLAGSATTRSSPENPSRSSANEATGCIEPLAVCAGGPKYGLVGGGVGLGEGEGLGDGAGVGVAVTRGPRPPKTVSRPEVETAMLACPIAIPGSGLVVLVSSGAGMPESSLPTHACCPVDSDIAKRLPTYDPM